MNNDDGDSRAATFVLLNRRRRRRGCCSTINREQGSRARIHLRRRRPRALGLMSGTRVADNSPVIKSSLCERPCLLAESSWKQRRRPAATGGQTNSAGSKSQSVCFDAPHQMSSSSAADRAACYWHSEPMFSRPAGRFSQLGRTD